MTSIIELVDHQDILVITSPTKPTEPLTVKVGHKPTYYASMVIWPKSSSLTEITN